MVMLYYKVVLTTLLQGNTIALYNISNTVSK